MNIHKIAFLIGINMLVTFGTGCTSKEEKIAKNILAEYRNDVLKDVSTSFKNNKCIIEVAEFMIKKTSVKVKSLKNDANECKVSITLETIKVRNADELLMAGMFLCPGINAAGGGLKDLENAWKKEAEKAKKPFTNLDSLPMVKTDKDVKCKIAGDSIKVANISDLKDHRK